MKKIDAHIVAEIRELKASGATYRELCEAYGVSQATIARYCAEPRKAARKVESAPEPAPAPAQADAPAPAPACESAPVMHSFTDKVCRDPHCGERLPHNARFCFTCGRKQLTQREEIMERLSAVIGDFRFFPEHTRDRDMAAVRDAMRFLSELTD